ncbi:MAG: YceI family protein [Cyclobacteriaceae bacterium]
MSQLLNHLNTLTILSLVSILVSCSSESKTSTLDTENAKALAEVEANAQVVKLDSINSIATWIGSKPTGQHNGYIPVSKGQLMVNDTEILSGKITFDVMRLKVMDMQEDTSKQQKLYRHLMNEDFFAADSFPNAQFDIVKIYPFDSTVLSQGNSLAIEAFKIDTTAEWRTEEPTHIVTGNLELRGINKHIAFPVSISDRNGIIRTEAKLSIDRTDWKLSYRDESSVIDRAKDKFIHNTVHIGLSIRTLPKQDQ